MKITPTSLAGVLELEPARFGDDRGWFSEVWNATTLAEHGLHHEWLQDNESLSVAAGTVRGIHYQLPPHAQDKLVRAVAGSILDVAVDLRSGSPTFGDYVAVQLDARQGNQLLIPKGFGHGFCTLEPNCHVAYKVSAAYAPESDCSLLWNDPSIGIVWPVDEGQAVVSDKDKIGLSLAAAPIFETV